MTEEHYVALIKIEKVTKLPGAGLAGRRDEVSETLKLVIKAETLESLKQKIAKHIELVDH